MSGVGQEALGLLYILLLAIYTRSERVTPASTHRRLHTEIKMKFGTFRKYRYH